MGEIIYGYAFHGKVRFSVVDSKDFVEEARLRHELSPIATAALGRAITAAALFTPWLDEIETLTFDFETKGPIGRIVAQGKGDRTVRGYVTNPEVEGEMKDGKFNVASVVRGGQLRVVRDLGLKRPVLSSVPIISGEIAEDITNYYAKSEQIPTAMVLGVFVTKEGTKAAGGYVIQVLDAGLSDREISRLESSIKEFGSITSHLLKGEKPEDVALQIFGRDVGDYIEEFVRYRCGCNREKALQSIAVLDAREIEEMKKENFAEVVCKWCGKKYLFDGEELDEALSLKLNL